MRNSEVNSRYRHQHKSDAAGPVHLAVRLKVISHEPQGIQAPPLTVKILKCVTRTGADRRVGLHDGVR